MGKRLLHSAVGAVILFIWGFVGHVAIGLYDPAYQGFADEAEVSAVLERNAAAAGLHYVPASPDRSGPPQAEAFVNFVPAGERSGFGAMVGRSLVYSTIAVFLVLTLLDGAGAAKYWRAVGRFAMVGFLLGFVTHAYYWNWFDFPMGYFALSVVDYTVGWTLVGLALVALGQRRRNERTDAV